MKKVAISVIVPVYNVEKYLNKCINSILNQTFKDFELIIIDDGSSDKSGLICDEYEKKDKRIKVIHQENKGLSAARNIGIDLAIGDYITFIDSDDYIDENYLCIFYSVISKNNADIVMGGNIIVNEDITTSDSLNKKYSFEIIEKRETYKKMMNNETITFSAWAKLYKSNLIKKIKYPIGKYYEDVYVINDIIECADKIIFTNYNGYYYLKRDDSIINSCMNTRHMDLIDAATKYKDFMICNYPELNSYTIKGFIISNFMIYNKAVLSDKFVNECKYIRKNILKYKKDVFFTTEFSLKIKLQTLLLWFGSDIYKLFLVFR